MCADEVLLCCNSASAYSESVYSTDSDGENDGRRASSDVKSDYSASVYSIDNFGGEMVVEGDEYAACAGE